PASDQPDFEVLKEICNQQVLLEINNEQKNAFTGHLEFLEEQRQLLFIGFPWPDLSGLVTNGELILPDFQDPYTSFLEIIKAQQAVNKKLPGDAFLNKNKEIEAAGKENIQFGVNFLSGRKILITDDNSLNRMVASIMLKNHGATVLEAADGQNAIEAANSGEPDLIFMDIQMPGINGFETTKILRKSGNQSPIIALTAGTIADEREACIAAGMNDYISKPLKEIDFLKIIDKWLNAGKHIDGVAVSGAIIPEEPLYDLTTLNSMSRGNTAFVQKMVNIFCGQTPPMIEEMLAAYNTMDFEKMSSIAHKLKPSIIDFNIKSLVPIIREIENSGKAADSSHLKEILNETRDIITKVTDLMRLTV
ncbi:MAG: response regulator, partial [Bacteroidia bacterium]